jgi:hypothetical protein
MRQYDDPGALFRERLDRRYEPLDPGRVGDGAVLQRHVQIGPQQYALAATVEILKGAEMRH